ncbi:MAG: decaprenyl-phosphate phosphoribosyltransferase [Acidobacteria bacterium]|nr:decaprenyl-phosphate phosphoribosyltransferase [Acidobacteriota bacterium]
MISYEADAVLRLRKRSLLGLSLAAMRPHQWVKNLFIFAPLLFGRKLTDLSAVGAALTTFCMFCLLSSALYIFNDWLDADEDRAHPEKRNRPISSGELPVPAALLCSASLAATAFCLAWWLGTSIVVVGAVYFVLIVAYSLSFKRLIVLDCIAIASGFVLRVIGGAVAINVVPTHWLIVCAFLLALFLAFSKRRQEMLTLLNNAVEHRKVLGQYSVAYLDQVNIILIGAAIVSYALYTVAPETVERFGTDVLIYGTVFVIYGMLRYLALINHPEKGGNPSKMLLRDRPLLITVVAWSLYNAIVIYHITLEEFLVFLFR